MRNTGHTDFGDDRFAAAPVYLTDLDSCRPEAALTRAARRGCWRVLDYETEGLSGAMLFAGPETAAQQVIYPLTLSGWHAVSIGAYVMWGVSIQLQVKLSDDRAFSILAMPQVEPDWTVHSVAREQLREMFWKVADLTGRELVVSQISWQFTSGEGPGAVQGADASIAYLKVVPLTETEAREVRDDRQRTDTPPPPFRP